jgi:hypothetical protein
MVTIVAEIDRDENAGSEDRYASKCLPHEAEEAQKSDWI